MANLPHRYSQEAQDERDWKKAKNREGDNYRHMKFNKKNFNANYDQIDWSSGRK